MRLAVLFLATLCTAADYDLILRNARIVDGAGAPWFRGDIGVRGGRIASVGNLRSASADAEIDAAGRVAAPGFIDVHTHAEDIGDMPGAENFLLDGVTTIVTGNCGGSHLDLAGWFGKLEAIHTGVNVASLVGHNTVRREVMGTANRDATADEIARMSTIIDSAMMQGAVGLSSGLEYVPGVFANLDELAACARAAASHGGVYATHLRNEGAALREAIAEAAEIGRRSGAAVQLSHLKIDNRKYWGSGAEILKLLDGYRAAGIDILADMYPYERSSTSLSYLIPGWALADGKLGERLRDPAARAKIQAELAGVPDARGHEEFRYATVAGYESDPSLEGKTIAAINASRNRPDTAEAQAATILEMLERGPAQMVYHSMGSGDVDTFLRHPNVAFASDGGVRRLGQGMPHPRSYGTNARVLGEYVRERGLLTLEEAVRRMTSLPARTFGLSARGLLRAGMAADIVVFDPGRVRDLSTFQKPHAFSEGFDYVLVNGRVAVENGKPRETRWGVVIRRESAMHARPR